MIQNIYASKIYAHNPIIIWSLDYFVSTPTSYVDSYVDLAESYGGPGAPSYSEDRSEGAVFAEETSWHMATSENVADLKTTPGGAPFVYGTSNVQNVIDGNGLPGIVFAGHGFMHESGKHKNYTFEFWTKIFSSSVTEAKIFGPISSHDGLYIKGPFLALRIGNNVKSYQVGEFERPMLVNIVYTPTSVQLLVNGVKVLSVDIDVSELTFPSESNQDWVGFYAYSDIPVIQLQCVAIYPYVMSESISKLHFVYGQGVDTPDLRLEGLKNVPVLIDYGTSKSANNYKYPANARWQQGVQDNIIAEDTFLRSPAHIAPTYFSSGSTSFDTWKAYNLYEDSQTPGGSFIRMQPIITNTGSTRITEKTSLVLDSMKLSGNQIDGFYLNGKADVITDSTNGDVAIAIFNNENKYFKIKVKANKVSYYFNSSTALKEDTITSGGDFSTAVKISDLLEDQENLELDSFFANADNLRVYFGGDDLVSTFAGRIYSFGLLSSTDMQKSSISSLFDTVNGLYTSTTITTLNSLTGVYSVKPSRSFYNYDIKVGSSSYWADVVPLAILSKQTADGSDYDLSFVQLNIDYPEFSSTSSSVVRTYVRLLDITDDIMSSELSTVGVQSDKIISFTPEDRINRVRYEFVDGNLIELFGLYASASNFLLKIEIEIVNDDIVRQDLGIRYLSLASWLIEEDSVIGTKHGRDIIPFGTYPRFEIYRDTTPYMYLSKNSGIKMIGSSFSSDKGIRIPINPTNDDNYYLGGIQFAAKFAETVSGIENVHFMTITDFEGFTWRVFYNTSTRVIRVIDRDNDSISSLGKGNIYINGQEDVDNKLTTLEANVWNIISISFSNLLSFGSNGGYIDIIGPFTINYISEIQVPPISVAQSIEYREWKDVDGDEDVTWGAYDPEGTVGDSIWSDVSLIPGSNISLDKLDVNVPAFYDFFTGFPSLDSAIEIRDWNNMVGFTPNIWVFRKDISPSSNYYKPL
jgi:hypothetical protein